MSLAPEDWKRFLVMSGQLRIGDASEEDAGVICNAKSGEWVAIGEYDDSHRLCHIVGMHEDLTKNMVDGVVKTDGVEEREKVLSDSGVFYVTDRKTYGKIPSGFEIPDSRLNEMIVEHYGKPTDDGKPERDKFVETCFHLCRDEKGLMPTLESFGTGVVFELARGSIEVDLLYNFGRDVIGFEIFKERG